MLSSPEESPIFKEPLFEIVKRYPISEVELPELIVDLIKERADHIDDKTAELVRTLIAKRFLPSQPFSHQEEALKTTISDKRHLVVTTGTGSGKTYCFLLPLLTKLLIDALGPKGAKSGKWDAKHELFREGWWKNPESPYLTQRLSKRKAAVRGLLLYPLNALVQDQMEGLREVFGFS
jgi:ATP-dependent helicase YprA (DUF1998 family)